MGKIRIIKNGANGINGKDGVTPYIDEETGHWFVNGVDTGITAGGKIDLNADCAILYATFLADGWSDTAPYTQTVEVNGIKEENSPTVDISYSSDSSLWEDEETAFECLTKVDTINNGVIGTCRKEKPTSDFTIKLKVSGDVNGLTFITREEYMELYNMVKSANESLENTLDGNGG